jgi:integrase
VALAERYLTEHAVPHKRAGPVADDRWLIRQWILPALGNTKVEAVEYSDIATLHRKITEYGTATSANRCVGLLGKMFNLARQWKWRDGHNPAVGIQRNPEQRRDRPLSTAEMTRLLAAVSRYPHRNAADAILLLALTGSRTGEVLKATWSQFDLDAAVWTKPSSHTKQKRDHRVPLPAAAVDLLASRPRGEGGDYVFPGRRAGCSLTSLSWPWRRICAQAGIPHGRKDGITPHDLRHSFGSFLGSGGESLPIIGALLGHTQPSTTLRYVHMFVDPLRAATERVAAHLTRGGTS